MKKYQVLFLLLSILCSGFSQKSQTSTPKKNTKITSATFSGHWKGEEKCESAGAPVAILTIITSGPYTVLVSGLYSTQGRVKGTVKDGILTIRLQQVDDPNFVNLALEATLTLSDDRKSLTARFNVQNNQIKDACTAVYKK